MLLKYVFGLAALIYMLIIFQFNIPILYRFQLVRQIFKIIQNFGKQFKVMIGLIKICMFQTSTYLTKTMQAKTHFLGITTQILVLPLFYIHEKFQLY